MARPISRAAFDKLNAFMIYDPENESNAIFFEKSYETMEYTSNGKKINRSWLSDDAYSLYLNYLKSHPNYEILYGDSTKDLKKTNPRPRRKFVTKRTPTRK